MYVVLIAYFTTSILTKLPISADQFDVPVPFLLKQAAWLYEKQLADVRAHMRRIGNSRATSIVGGHELSLAIQAQGRSGSLSGNNASGVASTSGSGSGTSMTVRGSRSGQGRGSFREMALNLSQVHSGLNVAGSPVDQAATQPSSAIATPRPAFLQLEPPARSFGARPPPSASINSQSASSETDNNDDNDDEDDDAELDRHRTLRRSNLFRPTRILSPSEHSGESSPRFLPFLAGVDDISEKSGDTADEDEDYDDGGGSGHRQEQNMAGRQAEARQSELGHTLQGVRRQQQSGNVAREPRTSRAAVLPASPRTASSISDFDGKHIQYA